MDRSLFRAWLVELIGTFALVYVGAGIVCVDHMTSPARAPGSAVMLEHQPGLVGIALAQGLIFTVILSVSLPISGGYHNPAITLMLWVFNRLDHLRTLWFLGAQLVGAVLAGFCLRNTFNPDILLSARFGTPHLNPLAFPPPFSTGTLATGSGIELVLTFLLVFAIFGMLREGGRRHLAAIAGGLALTACVMLGYRLTGAALNPARWFGTVLWEAAQPNRPPGPGAFADMFVYVFGPVVGALLGGLVYFKVLQPSVEPTTDAEYGLPAPTGEPHKMSSQVRAKK